jgi:Cd(II)/Pb(II)-responsive transcriptional regulator
MKIGELAKVTGTQVETIRYYERKGLLAPSARTEGNFRVYANEHAMRLSFIRHCRSLDMTLDEIRKLLCIRDAPTEDCAEVIGILDAHIGHVASRIRELRVLEEQLNCLRERCDIAQDSAHCGILVELSQPVRVARQRGSHVH